ncbi:protein kinase [Melioribacteraceae bacterium 4301-Me]|uniref:protein kinase domain-containing protein n=1 Tax=Pyranulibacter aquaticus TaxID=3163344 RepID=UPI00359B6C11
MENIIGKTIDNYRITSVLGRGGMGIVYKAYDTKLDRYVAIKLLNPSVYSKQGFVERFKREAKNQAKLSHPNIVTVYGFIEYSDLLGIVMEYVEGESLEKVIQRQGRFHLYDVIYILRQVLLGLGYAHSKGFVHRDIKPSNIILNKEGITKIMDFGISKSLFDKDVTQPGSKIGTIYYMSPEQIKGTDVTNRSDIYSIGCTVYEMLIGEPPFNYDNEFELMEAHLKKKAPRISDKLTNIPETLDHILQRMMEKNPLDRYGSCEEVFNDLAELEKLVTELTNSYFQQRKPITPKSKVLSTAAFVLIIFGLLALSWFVYNQVNTLLKSNKLDEFKKYNIQSLFSSSEDSEELPKVEKLNSNIKENLNAVIFLDSKNGFVLGDSGTVAATKDSGKTWLPIELGTKRTFHDAYFFQNGKSFIIGDSATLIYSRDFLKSFQTLSVNAAANYSFFRIKFIDKNVGFICGDKGLILRTEDGGFNWYKVETNSKDLLFDIGFADKSTGFAIGWNGEILKSNDRGNTWTSIEKVTDDYLKSIDFNKNGYGLIVGGGGTIIRTKDYGNSWEKNKIDIDGGLQKVQYISDDNVLALGVKGMLLFSNSKGETWQKVNTGVFSKLNSMTVNPSGHVFIVGTGGTILKFL